MQQRGTKGRWLPGVISRYSKDICGGRGPPPFSPVSFLYRLASFAVDSNYPFSHPCVLSKYFEGEKLQENSSLFCDSEKATSKLRGMRGSRVSATVFFSLLPITLDNPETVSVVG